MGRLITIELVNEDGCVIANAQTEIGNTDVVTSDVVEIISNWKIFPGDTIKIISEGE